MENASLLGELFEFSLEGVYRDPRVSKYLYISATKDTDVLESSAIGGHEKSTDSSLSSSTTCSISCRPSSSKSASHCGDSFLSSHYSQDSMIDNAN
jgi:hypothetical protein